MEGQAGNLNYNNSSNYSHRTYQLFFTTPLYRATAIVDPEPYGFKTTDVIRQFASDTFVTETIEGLSADVQAALSHINIRENDKLIEVVVEKPDPAKAKEIADTVALSLAKNMGDCLQNDMLGQVERLEYSIAYFDHQIQALLGLEEGEALSSEMFDDPMHESLRQEQGMLMVELLNARLAYETVELGGSLGPEQLVRLATPTTKPVNRNWPLNAAVAGVLGLMLSVFFVFLKPHLAELKKELSK